MIKLKTLLLEDQVSRISYQDAFDRKMFGPVYHGTTEEKREKIDKEGFRIFLGKQERTGNLSHGYSVMNYYNGIPAPLHHLGFGIYFTTSRAIAKQFNINTTRGLKVYFLDIPRLEVINFAAPKTMMRWWIRNGYDYKLTPETTIGGMRTSDGGTKNTLPAIYEERYRATLNLTEQLKSKYDGVWFKGKGMFGHRLDGDQVVVFDSKNIYQIDKTLIKPGEFGSKVRLKVGIDNIPAGTKGIIRRKYEPSPLQTWAKDSKYLYDIKFEKGGYQFGILDSWIDFV